MAIFPLIIIIGIALLFVLIAAGIILYFVIRNQNKNQ